MHNVWSVRDHEPTTTSKCIVRRMAQDRSVRKECSLIITGAHGDSRRPSTLVGPQTVSNPANMVDTRQEITPESAYSPSRATCEATPAAAEVARWMGVEHTWFARYDI